MLDQLGDAVVGLDNNMLVKKGRFGGYWNEQGATFHLGKTLGIPQSQGSPYLAMALSLYNIRMGLNNDYAGTLDLSGDEEPVVDWADAGRSGDEDDE